MHTNLEVYNISQSWPVFSTIRSKFPVKKICLKFTFLFIVLFKWYLSDISLFYKLNWFLFGFWSWFNIKVDIVFCRLDITNLSYITMLKMGLALGSFKLHVISLRIVMTNSNNGPLVRTLTSERLYCCFCCCLYSEITWTITLGNQIIFLKAILAK